MGITLKRSLHIDPEDIPLLDEVTKQNLLKHKLIMRAGNSEEGVEEIEKMFTWVAETCENHYMIRGPQDDQDTIKYFIYFADETEATQFKLTFPQA